MKRISAIPILIFLFYATTVFSKPTDNSEAMGEPAFGLDFYRIRAMADDIEAKIYHDPDDMGNYIALADLYYRTGLWEQASEALQDAIKHRKKGFELDLYGWLADDLFNQSKMEEGKEALDTALKEFPDRAGNYYNLAVYYFFKKDYAAAGRLMKTIADKDKETQDSYYDLYNHLLDKKQPDHDGLIQMVRAALEQEPGNYKTHRLYAAALRNVHLENFEKEFPEILEHLQKALELNPKYVLTHITIANTYVLRAVYQKDKKYFVTALQWLNKARKVDPNFSKLDYVYANTYLYAEDFTKAVQYAQRYHKRHPNDPEGIKLLTQAYNGLAYDCYKRGKSLDEGLKIIEKALKLDPESGMYLSTKAELLYKLKRYQEAHELIKQAHAKLPYEEEINRDLAMIEAALKLTFENRTRNH